MSEISSQLVAKLKQIRDLTDSLLAELGESSIESPPDVQQKVDNRVCLQCGRSVGEDEQYRRGLCTSDYETTRRKIRSGEVNESDLVREGLMAPATTPGRKKAGTALDEYLATKHKRTDADAAELLAQIAADEKELRVQDAKKRKSIKKPAKKPNNK